MRTLYELLQLVVYNALFAKHKTRPALLKFFCDIFLDRCGSLFPLKIENTAQLTTRTADVTHVMSRDPVEFNLVSCPNTVCNTDGESTCLIEQKVHV